MSYQNLKFNPLRNKGSFFTFIKKINNIRTGMYSDNSLNLLFAI